MIAIVIAYLIAQALSSLFLFYHLHDSSSFITHCILAAIAFLCYVSAHYRSPGYANAEMLKLTSANKLDLSGSAIPTSHKISTDQAVATIQRGFCRHCKEDQLVRMKHCHDCNKCVATFDHHCLWLNNCIGEKNRPLFYLCLWSNLSQIVFAFIALIVDMLHVGEWLPSQIAFLSMIGLVGSGVGSLAFFHTYLMAINVTTWQFIRWNKIHYLIDLEKKDGWPFDRGIIRNIVEYWKISFQSKFKEWKFNKETIQRLKNKTEEVPKEKQEQLA